MPSQDLNLRLKDRTIFELEYPDLVGIRPDRRLPLNARMVSHTMTTPPSPMPTLITPFNVVRYPGCHRTRHKHPRIVSASMAYLAYAPVALPSEGPLSVLALAHIPIKEENGLFYLRNEISKRWRAWEDSLVTTCRLLKSYSNALPFSIEPALPSRFPYDKRYRTKQEAILMAQITQDLFRPWIALLTYTLACLDPKGSAVPPWVQYLRDNHASLDWIDELTRSPFWSVKSNKNRVGAVLASISEPSANIEYRRMILCDLPAYYLWTEADGKEMSKYIGSDVYNIEATDNVYVAPEPIVEQPLPDLHFTFDDQAPVDYDDHTDTNYNVAPAPQMITFDGANQLRGESPNDFVARRSIINTFKGQKETYAEQQERWQRIREFEDHPVPNRKYRPQCFRWVLFELGRGGREYWVRKPWSMAKAKAEWYQYSNEMRKYDSFHNEWDINTMWGTSYIEADSEGDDNDDDDYPETKPVDKRLKLAEPELEDYDELQKTEDVGQQAARARWWTSVGLEEEDRAPIATSVCEVKDIFHYLWTYFGCNRNLYDPLEKILGRLKVVQKLLGVSRRSYVTGDTDGETILTWSRIQNFYKSSLDGAGPGLQTVLPRGIELSVEDVDELEEIEDGEMVADGRVANTIQRKRYVLGRADAATNQYRIVVFSRLTVAYLLSQLQDNEEDPFHIASARILVACGFRFSTARTMTRPAISYSVSFPCGLGFRESDWRPTWRDYDMYVADRDEILTQLHSRAIYLSGGILWRIAIHAKGLDVDSVVNGPSSEAAARMGSNGVHREDDALTDNEINVLCGVFLVYTGHETPNTAKKKKEGGEYESLQTEKRSLFPTPNLWPSLGYWSEWDEEMFQTRLQEIREGEFQLRTTADWRKTTRSLRDRKKLLWFRDSKMTILPAE